MPTRRVIRDLKSVELLGSKPAFIPTTNHRGSRKAGLIYENKVAQLLKDMLGDENVLHQPWFKYTDAKGDGWCSPDLVILPNSESHHLVIGECKLTVTPAAERKLRNIYMPICAMHYQELMKELGISLRMVQICANLTVGWDDLMVNGLEDIYDPKTEWDFATWNWRF